MGQKDDGGPEPWQWLRGPHAESGFMDCDGQMSAGKT
jgi:hypothetical protein